MVSVDGCRRRSPRSRWGARRRCERSQGPARFAAACSRWASCPESTVRVVTIAPLGDPLRIEVRHGQWSIRKAEAAQIAVEPIERRQSSRARHCEPVTRTRPSARRRGRAADRARRQSERRQDDAVQRAHRLVREGLELSGHHGRAPHRRARRCPPGPPSSTICPARTASTRAAPRSRSRSTRSPASPANSAPDVVVVCLDATQLARSVYLLLQCRELGARCVGALTMVDEAGAAAPDARALSRARRLRGRAVTARTKRGLPELIAAIDRAARTERRAHWRWTAVARAARRISTSCAARCPRRLARRPRATAPQLPGADDAIALWALTCVDISEHDADELVGVPPDLRATVIARALRARRRSGARALGVARSRDPEARAQRTRSLAAPSASIACCSIAPPASRCSPASWRRCSCRCSRGRRR